MKILIIHPDLGELGGGEKVFVQVTKTLLEKKQEIIILGKMPENEEYQDIKTEQIVQIPCKPYSEENTYLKNFQAYKRLIQRELYRRKFRKKIKSVDIEILTQDPTLVLDVGVKKVAYVHYPEFIDLATKTRFRNLWRIYYFPISARINQLIKKIDLLLCNSEYTKAAILKQWGREAEVIYPPVEVERFYTAPKEKLVVSVGRFVQAKNYEVIVEVAKMLPQLKFVIIGRIPRNETNRQYYEKINKTRPENLTLLTDVSTAETASILSKAKIYLHTMVGEHFGISIVEGMAAGCIPVAHNSGGVKESIGNFGFTYNTIAECIDCINKALDCNISPSKIIENAARFSSKEFGNKLIRVLEEKAHLI
jgi:alpha-1,2-mannosyltransferase